MNSVESSRSNETLAAAAYGSSGYYDPDDVLPPASPSLQAVTLQLRRSPTTPPPKVTEVKPSHADGVLVRFLANGAYSDVADEATNHPLACSEDEDEDECSPEPPDIPATKVAGPGTSSSLSSSTAARERQQHQQKQQQEEAVVDDDQWAHELLQYPETLSRLPHETLVHRQPPSAGTPPTTAAVAAATAQKPQSQRHLPDPQPQQDRSSLSPRLPPPRLADQDGMSLDFSLPPVHHQSLPNGASGGGSNGSSNVNVFASMAQVARDALAATESSQPKQESSASLDSHDPMALDPRLDHRQQQKQQQLPSIDTMTRGENAPRTAGPSALKLKSMALGALGLDDGRKSPSSERPAIRQGPYTSVEADCKQAMTVSSEATYTMPTPASVCTPRDILNSAASTPAAAAAGPGRDERLVVSVNAMSASLVSPSASIQSPNDYASMYSPQAGSSTTSPRLQQQGQTQTFSPRSRSSSQADPHYQARPSAGSTTALPRQPLPPIQQYGSPPTRVRSDSVNGPQTILPSFREIANIGSLPEPALNPRPSIASASALSSFSHPSPSGPGGPGGGPGSLSRPRLPSLSRHQSSPPPISPDDMYRRGDMASPTSTSSLSTGGPSPFYFSPISAGGSSISSTGNSAYAIGDRRPTEYSISSAPSTSSGGGGGMMSVPQLPVPQPLGASSARAALAPAGCSSVRSASVASSVASRGSVGAGVVLSSVGNGGQPGMANSNSRLPPISSGSTHIPADHHRHQHPALAAASNATPIHKGLTLMTPSQGARSGSGAAGSAAAGAGAAQGQAFICKVPGCTAQPFQTQYLLNSHANVHSSSRPHYCPVAGCPRSVTGRGFKRKNEMKRHGLVHDSPGYVCPFCPEREHRYPRPDNLQRHVKVHHKDKSKDDPQLRDVLSQRPEGPSRGRRRRLI